MRAKHASHLQAEHFDEILYSLIESGIPLISSLSSRQHAVALIGHGHLRQVEAEWPGVRSASSFVSGYVTADDNRLPYSLFREGDRYTPAEIDAVIAPLYGKMYLDIARLLERVLPKFEEKFLPASCGYVRRLFITSSRSFKRFLLGGKGCTTYKDELVSLNMPKFIWVAEYSTKEEYPVSLSCRALFDMTALAHASMEQILLSVKLQSKLYTEIGSDKYLELSRSDEPLYVNNLTCFGGEYWLTATKK